MPAGRDVNTKHQPITCEPTASWPAVYAIAGRMARQPTPAQHINGIAMKFTAKSEP
jgi:hypothetical protein